MCPSRSQFRVTALAFGLGNKIFMRRSSYYSRSTMLFLENGANFSYFSLFCSLWEKTKRNVRDNFFPILSGLSFFFLCPGLALFDSAYAASADGMSYTNSIGMEFVRIPPGAFTMGRSPKYEKNDEEDDAPAHHVTISKSFYLGRYEVTQAQWRAIMGNNPSRVKDRKKPVEGVSWDDVQEFIRRLNWKEKTNKYRLPAEAEWEYAARSGMDIRFLFEEDTGVLGSHAWFCDNSGGGAHPVGQKRPNAWGLYDMYGNVWEWVNDWYDENYYTRSPVNDPQGPSSGLCRVVRGCSWINGAKLCRSTFRGCFSPSSRFDFIGFRLAFF